MSTFSLNKLTEGIRDRHVGVDAKRIQEKWTRTGLLRGLTENKRETMSRLLENQAAQVLREANTLSGGASGNIDGFSNIAFPIVRRVFGGLVANELVSIQPMSLPSGLLFYLDYTYGSDVGAATAGTGNQSLTRGTDDGSVYTSSDSLYGSPSGNSLQSGADAVGGMYDLAGSSYSKVNRVAQGMAQNETVSGQIKAFGNGTAFIGSYNSAGTFTTDLAIDVTVSKNLQLLGYDPQLVKEITENSTAFFFCFLDATYATGIDRTMIKSAGLMEHTGLSITSNVIGEVANDSAGLAFQQGTALFNIRRLNQMGTWSGTLWTQGTAATNVHVLTVIKGGTATTTSAKIETDLATGANAGVISLAYAVEDSAEASGGGTGGSIVIPSFESNFDGTSAPTPIIPEIDIKIESIAVTAQTRKLRARWSPELAQDLNAYHSMDAEVELTQILSEQIALEIDREILNDLLVEAKGANFFWSRAPGKFVNKRSGAAQNLSSTLATGPQFTGTVREWYETLVETIIDVANEIHRKTLRGSANFIVVSPEVATVFEASVLYKPSIKIDGQGQASSPFSIGAEAIGSLSNRFTVYKDPYFPRNKILVGYKGGSYLESGYVYAPYVPLIVTPTIFAPEDFTPRKGVMTRYGKKMVRADFYGTVTCLDMDII